MNTGVEILLKRMETHPDDFVYSLHSGGMSRWMRLVDHAIGEELLTLEEHEAIKAGMKEVKRLRFTEMVMKELVGVEDEPSEDPKSNPYLAPSATRLAGATLGHSNTGLGYQALSQATAGHMNTAVGSSAFLDAQRYQMEQMKLHLDAHREAMKQEESAKHWWNKSIPELLGKK